MQIYNTTYYYDFFTEHNQFTVKGNLSLGSGIILNFKGEILLKNSEIKIGDFNYSEFTIGSPSIKINLIKEEFSKEILDLIRIQCINIRDNYL